jgi:hypothetical protein
MASVQAGQISFSGMVDNLSMKGIFISTNEVVPSDILLEISIVLSGTSSLLSIKAKGFALRQTDTGVAIEFREMDIDSFVHLRNVVALNSDDADACYEEYYQAIMSK